MTKLILLLVVTSIFQISLADITVDNCAGTNSDSIEDSSEEWSSSSNSAASASSSSSSSSSSSTSSSKTQIVEDGPPPETNKPKCKKPNKHAEDSSPQTPDTPKCTKPNEHLVECPAPCPFRTCGIDDNLIDCAPFPSPGDPDCPPPACQCKPQFFRDDKGNCVPWEKCPKCNKPNEVYDPCDAPCPGRSCDVDPRLVKCGRPPQVGDENCVVGCRCMDGYFRNKNGRCVPWDQCPKKQPTCGPNEVYDECDAPCPGRSCDVDPRLVRCKAPPKPGDEECIKGCRCKDGFARNQKGQCIPREKCPPKQPVCGKNEVYDECDAPCPGRTCDVDPALVLCKPAPKPGDKDCVEGCRCVDGYARDQNGNCIPRDQCPPKPNCGPNEEYDPCPDCSPQTCEMMNQTYHCPRLPASKMGPGCHPSCRCKKEYFRNKIGECIHASDCAKCTKPHEYFSCGGACDNVCENIKEQNQTNCPIINIQCNKMCYCEADYARDYKGDCIPIKDCPTCPENERYDPCPATLCGPKTCDEAGFPLNCTQREEGAKCPGKPGCVCKDGYLRDKHGKCIPTDQCPSCGGDKNATLGCGINCNRHCSDLDQEEPRMCILVCYPNSCDCRTDSQGREYYYDSNLKMCVLAEDCTPQCKDNEVYSECANGGCTKQKCTDINKPVVCVYPKICKKGCVCAPGYLRAKNGTCVPSEQCDPPPKCKANEEFSKCGRDGCLKYYCSDLDLPPLCRDTFQCIPQCECKEGYLRASVDNSTCVPVDQCPRRCKENEQYSECPAASCQPQTCKEAGYPVPCPIVGPDGQCSGDPGCICVPGYLRNDKGKCIPQDQCPSCGGDKNAVPGCGNHCGNTCATYNSTKPVPCPLYCDLNGCNCREKYVYDENLHKCVLPKDCTPKCKANEEFSTCSNAICRAQYCADKDKPVACPAIAKGYCKKGCVCKEHYLRDKKGNCIPEKECKPNDLCPKGEIFSHCPPIQCDAEYCPKSRDAPQRCPMPKKCGPPRCICPFNHHRHRNNCKCIPTSQCRPFPCDGPNEHYDSCPPVCRDKSCTDYLKNVTCPKFSLSVKVACRPACLCNEGYYRDSEGICVSAKECIETACKINEEYSTCSNAICQPQECADKGKPVPCPEIEEEYCTKGCVCKKHFLRNKKGICVPEDECDQNDC